MKRQNLLRIVGLLFGLALTVTAAAAPTGVAVAQAQAQQFMASRHAGRLMAPAASLRLAHVENSTAKPAAADYYVFNATDGSSFVIIAGDDRAFTVLGYGNGALDVTNAPCNMRWWLGQYKQQMEYLHAHPELREESSTDLRASSMESVMPMVSCNWSQSEPYYNMCPVVNGEHCVTGCVATAMAQVMYYWRYPSGCGALDAYTTAGSTTKPRVEVDALPGTAFDWDNMIDNYLGSYTDAQAAAVATLMRYCGQSSSMGYGVDGSGAYVSAQLSGMRFMGYSSSMAHIRRYSYSSRSAWIAQIETELEARRPILYSGSDPTGGHAFVLDGMLDGLFHINWGWAGTGNGYFAMDAFNVRDYEFNNNQEMIVRIQPSNPVDHTTSDYDIVQDGICYKIVDGQASVTCRDTRYASYAGAVTIPGHVVVGSSDASIASYPVTAIADDAFRNCSQLTSVTLPSTVRSIGQRAFRNCSSLSMVVLPDELEYIGKQAFANCVSLTSINLPHHLKTIDEYAFEECYLLASVHISSALNYVGPKAFHECNSLTEVHVDSLEHWYGITFADASSNPLYFARRLMVDGVPVEHLVVPGTVDKVKDFAFVALKNLKSLVFEDGVQAVGRSAFAYCPGLQTISFPNSVTSINGTAFYSCSDLQSLQLPDGLVTIGANAFAECSGLTQLLLPSSLQTIGSSAFKACAALTNVTFTRSLQRVGSDAFEGCTSLSRVTISDMNSWCRIAFGNEYANPLRLAHHLYLDDWEVHDLDIPSSVTAINPYAFSGASFITSLTMGDQVKSVGTNAFGQCKTLTDVTLGKGVKTLGSRAFSYCYGLERVVTPDVIEAIGDSAFYFCSALEHVTLGRNLASLGRMAFYFCDAVDTIVCRAQEPPHTTSQSCFSYYKSQLLVPKGSESSYKTADVWKKFTQVKGIDMVYDIHGDVNGDGELGIADINALIDVILVGGGQVAKLDVNGDGEITVADVNALIDLIME